MYGLMVVGIVAGASFVIIAATTYWCKCKYTIEAEVTWHQVGELYKLFAYPLKSGCVVNLNEVECTSIGIQIDKLHDRMFRVEKESSGKVLNGETCPTLVTVVPSVNGDEVTFSTKGKDKLVVDIGNLVQGKTQPAEMLGVVVKIDCGDEAAQWFSTYLIKKDDGLRLIYFPYDIPKSGNNGGYSLISTGSMADLNRRLWTPDPVEPHQMRCNFVVNGPLPYSEDTWKHIKIGETVEFTDIKSIGRTPGINTHPAVGETDKLIEPLTTIKTYRGEHHPSMGVYLRMIVPGIVRVGDPVYIIDYMPR